RDKVGYGHAQRPRELRHREQARVPLAAFEETDAEGVMSSGASADTQVGMASRRSSRGRSGSSGLTLLAGLFVVGVVIQVLAAIGPVLARVLVFALALVGVACYMLVGALVVDGARSGWELMHSRPAL